jgi:hypothetical protein
MAATKKDKVTKKVETKEVCFVIMPFGGWFDSNVVKVGSTPTGRL